MTILIEKSCIGQMEIRFEQEAKEYEFISDTTHKLCPLFRTLINFVGPFLAPAGALIVIVCY